VGLRIALDSEKRISDALKKKLTETIAKARRQLFALEDCAGVLDLFRVVDDPFGSAPP